MSIRAHWNNYINKLRNKSWQRVGNFHNFSSPGTIATRTAFHETLRKKNSVGSWCPVCNILCRASSQICGICEIPTVLIKASIVNAFLQEHEAIKKIEKGDIVGELIGGKHDS